VKPALVVEFGAVYHTGTVADLGLSPDIEVVCTGVVPFIQQVADVAPGGIVCLVRELAQP